MIDVTSANVRLAGYCFRAVEMTDINTGEKCEWRVIGKRTGRGHKWQYVAFGGEALTYSERPASVVSTLNHRAKSQEGEWVGA